MLWDKKIPKSTFTHLQLCVVKFPSCQSNDRTHVVEMTIFLNVHSLIQDGGSSQSRIRSRAHCWSLATIDECFLWIGPPKGMIQEFKFVSVLRKAAVRLSQACHCFILTFIMMPSQHNQIARREIQYRYSLFHYTIP